MDENNIGAEEDAARVNPTEFDDILAEVDEFGIWQKKVYFLASLIGIFTGMNALAPVFVAADTDHWCRVAAWDNDNCTGTARPNAWQCVETKRNASIPLVTNNVGKLVYDGCNMYNVAGKNFTSGLNVSDYWTNDTIPCSSTDGWVYDTRQYEKTIITEYGLTCDLERLVSVSQSVYFSGLLVGSLVFGSLADWIGRKPTIIIGTIVMITPGIAIVFSPNIIVYIILRFFVAAGGMGAFISAYVLGSEFIGPSRRVLTGISYQGFFAVGLLILPLLAYFIRSWRGLQLCIAAPAVLYFLVFFYVPESARWLISKQKYDKAEKILRRLARANKKEFPEEMFSPESIRAAMEKAAAGRETVAALFCYPNMFLKTLNLMFYWFVVNMVYYGLGLSTSDLGVNDYLAAAIAALVEFPSYIYCIYGVEKFGRRDNISGSMTIGGVACVISAFLEPGVVRTAIAMIGKFCISAAFAIAYVVCGEIYPTPVRSAGVGVCSTAARISGILSPFILELKDIWAPFPFVVFGGLAIVAGLLSAFLPETKGRKLPETMEEGEAFGKPRCLKHETETVDEVAMATITMREIPDNKSFENPGFGLKNETNGECLT